MEAMGGLGGCHVHSQDLPPSSTGEEPEILHIPGVLQVSLARTDRLAMKAGKSLPIATIFTVPQRAKIHQGW